MRFFKHNNTGKLWLVSEDYQTKAINGTKWNKMARRFIDELTTMGKLPGWTEIPEEEMFLNNI